jgi:hypothetical protein
MRRERLLKFIFFLTFPWALLWTLGLIFEDFFDGYLPTRNSWGMEGVRLIPLAGLYVLTFFLVIALSKVSPNFMLIQPSVKSARIVKIFILTATVSYFAAVIITFLISDAVISDDTSFPNAENERALLVFLISLLLPPWWILPISTIATGIVLNRKLKAAG